MLNLKDLLTVLPSSDVSALGERLRRSEVNLLIPKWLKAKSGRRTEKRRAQSKGLANASSVERWGNLFGSWRATETWCGRSVDSRRVVGQVAEENGRRLYESK